MPIVWLWMFIAGLGVGPTFSVFTIVIQNAVPFQQLGVATSNLTFFRQIGGTVALAFVGTIFATLVPGHLVPQMTAAGRAAAGHRRVHPGEQQRLARLQPLTGVGDLGAAILAAIPPAFQAAVQPFIGAIVEGVHGAFSLGDRPDLLARRGRLDRGARCLARDQGDPAPDVERAAGPGPDDRQTAAAAAARRVGQARAGLGQHRRRRLTSRSSSHSTAPVDPTGAVVRPRATMR